MVIFVAERKVHFSSCIQPSKWKLNWKEKEIGGLQMCSKGNAVALLCVQIKGVAQGTRTRHWRRTALSWPLKMGCLSCLLNNTWSHCTVLGSLSSEYWECQGSERKSERKTERGRDSNAERKEVKERWKRKERRKWRWDKWKDKKWVSKSEQKTEGHAEGIQRTREHHWWLSKFWQRVYSIKIGSLYFPCMKFLFIFLC